MRYSLRIGELTLTREMIELRLDYCGGNTVRRSTARRIKAGLLTVFVLDAAGLYVGVTRLQVAPPSLVGSGEIAYTRIALPVPAAGEFDAIAARPETQYVYDSGRAYAPPKITHFELPSVALTDTGAATTPEIKPVASPATRQLADVAGLDTHAKPSRRAQEAKPTAFVPAHQFSAVAHLEPHVKPIQPVRVAKAAPGLRAAFADAFIDYNSAHLDLGSNVESPTNSAAPNAEPEESSVSGQGQAPLAASVAQAPVPEQSGVGQADFKAIPAGGSGDAGLSGELPPAPSTNPAISNDNSPPPLDQPALI